MTPHEREVMQQALDALEQITPDWRTSIDKHEQLNNSIEALRARLEKPEREWVSLTEKEHTELAIECGCLSADWVFYGAAVERKLKEKNGG